MIKKNRFGYKEIDVFKELLELKHLKTKIIFVNVLLIAIAITFTYVLINFKYDFKYILYIDFQIFIVILVNILIFSFNEDQYNYLTYGKYFTSLSVFIISISAIFMFKTPSVVTSLFLAYALSAIYQDYKVMFLSNLILFFSGTLFIFKYPEVFKIRNAGGESLFLILLFLIIFVILLTISSYILIKQKNFFYNHISKSKEAEYRNIDLLLFLQKMHLKKDIDFNSYYDNLEKFTDEISKKIGIENIFLEKIQIIRDLNENLSLVAMQKKYPKYTKEDFIRLQDIKFSESSKLRKLCIKSSQSSNIKVSKREIFSENQFKTFNHISDSIETKIISFAVFYSLLKLDKPYLKSLSEEQIYEILKNTDYYYIVEKDILDIYLENNNVFDRIIKSNLYK